MLCRKEIRSNKESSFQVFKLFNSFMGLFQVIYDTALYTYSSLQRGSCRSGFSEASISVYLSERFSSLSCDDRLPAAELLLTFCCCSVVWYLCCDCYSHFHVSFPLCHYPADPLYLNDCLKTLYI